MGVTRKLSFLFSGLPGTGKTSTIKGILNKSGRHAISINLNKVKTSRELQLLFRKRKFNNKEYSNNELCYILEDFDAINDNKFLLSRSENHVESHKDESKSDILQLAKMFEPSKISNDDSLNLSDFLNILDGLEELNEKMIIFTTNHPEKIDPALIRPGRIDFKFEFKRMSKKSILDMIKAGFRISSDDLDHELSHNLNQKIDLLPDEILTPAEVQRICFGHIPLFEKTEEDTFENKRPYILSCINEILENANRFSNFE